MNTAMPSGGFCWAQKATAKAMEPPRPSDHHQNGALKMAEENVIESVAFPDADALFAQVLSCDPALHPDEMECTANLVFNQERVGRPWRLAAALASKDGAFFRELAEDEAKAKTFAATIDQLRDFSALLRSVADLADCAAARVMVAGCNHEGFNTWTEEASS